MDRLQARKKLLWQVKRQVERKLGPTPSAIRAYARPFERETHRKFEASTKQELLRSISQAAIVYGADFHAFAQAQRTHLKLLRSLGLTPNRRLIIALEALPAGHDKEIRDYLSGKLSEASFLNKVQWRKNWGFPWESYRPLFDLARERNFQIIGLSPEGALRKKALNLKVRDTYAAKILKRIFKEVSQPLVYVIFGELHLADVHLPAAVAKTLKYKPSSVKIYLNCEPIYFSLGKKKQADLDVVRMKSRQVSFCILSSPPWVQWQSYLMYLDQAPEDNLQNDDADEIDYTDRISAMIDVLSQDLRLRFKAHDLAVYTSQDDLLWSILERKLSSKTKKIAQKFVSEGKSFFLPKLGLAYLGRTAVNPAAELAGQYIHAKLCQRTIEFGKMPLDFERMIWIKAVGYYLSKLINPKRQAKTLGDLQNELSHSTNADVNANESKQILSLALDQRMSEVIWTYEKRKRRKQAKPRQRSSYDQAARILGDMLGERLYLAMLSRKISRAELMDLLKFDLNSESFDAFYRQLVARLEPVAKTMKDKKERL